MGLLRLLQLGLLSLLLLLSGSTVLLPLPLPLLLLKILSPGGGLALLLRLLPGSELKLLLLQVGGLQWTRSVGWGVCVCVWRGECWEGCVGRGHVEGGLCWVGLTPFGQHI